ncbi:hypothetical protein [Synechococcus sp. ROS8604]|uniref:hypothetical protein n=1 Tax=Synechococcus sp. ROS8604 TaxID=1442557 RepID=UPI001647E05C|nr:hypothetical protein [Synechococcus sp. ROS8604]
MATLSVLKTTHILLISSKLEGARKRRAAMGIEAFRKHLIDANPKMTSAAKQELISEDLGIPYEALDRITDNLGRLINETKDTEKIVYYAQISGERCSHFNGIAMLLEDYSQDV